MAQGDKKPVIMEADIGVEGGVPPYLHASQHSASGTDPITPSIIGAKSNEQLLNNADFRDPIDQRGGYVVPPGTYYYIPNGAKQETPTTTYYKVDHYSANGNGAYFYIDGTMYITETANIVRGYVGTGYGIDRWRVQQETKAVVLVEDGYITLKGTANDGLYQPFPHEQFTNGDILTISVLTAEGELLTKTVTVGEVIGYNDIWSCALIYQSAINAWYCYPIITYAGSEQTINIKAVKLELGSVQTLAHQDEDGNWVLNDPPPDKHLELLKCCMSTADPSDTYANNKLTPAAINAVNKAGDTMTDDLFISKQGGGKTAVRQWYDANWYGNNTALEFVAEDGITRRLGLNKGGILHQYYDGSVWNNYDILHTGNKPSGSYTGNGDATQRTIALGGIGDYLGLVNNQYLCFVGPNGAIISDGNTVRALPANSCHYLNGTLTLATNDPAVNPQGVECWYKNL